MLFASGCLVSDELVNVFKWLAGPALEIALLACMIHRKLHRSFPSFLFLHHLPDSEIGHPVSHLSLLRAGLLRRVLDRQRHQRNPRRHGNG